MATFNTVNGSALTANFFVSGVYTREIIANIQPQIQFISGANANNQTFSDPNIATFLDNTYADVFVNGVLQVAGDYVINGTTLTLNTPLQLGDRVTVGATGAGGGTGNLTTANILDANIGNAIIGNANITNLYAANGNITNLVVGNSANLGNVGNIYIGGGNAGEVLTTHGNGSLYWSPAATGNGTGTVTSVGANGGGLGFALSAGPNPITTAGNVVLSVPTSVGLRTSLNIGNVANTNYNGNGNQVLAGNGSWITVSSGSNTVPGGTSGQMQFNNGGVFGGSNVTYYTANGNMAMGSKNIINMADPVNPQDAATKAYVDLMAQGITAIIDPVQATSDTNLAGTYNNGTAGVGATLTLGTPLTTLDGVALSAGSRILVKGQTSTLQNGVYVYTNSTTLTRAADADTPAELDSGSFVFCEGGTTYNKAGFILTSTVTTVGTSPVVFQQFSGAGSYTAGTGLQLSGSQFSLTDTGITAAQYGGPSTYPVITLDAQGRATFAVSLPLPTYGNVADLNLDGNVSNVLRGDGTWAPVSATPGLPNNSIQFNSGNVFTGSADLTYSNGTVNITTLEADSTGDTYANPAIAITSYGPNVDVDSIHYTRARGNSATPANLVAGDRVFEHTAFAYNTVKTVPVGNISFAAGTTSATVSANTNIMPGRFDAWVGSDGYSVSGNVENRVERFRVSGGNNSITGSGSTTSTAIPGRIYQWYFTGGNTAITSIVQHNGIYVARGKPPLEVLANGATQLNSANTYPLQIGDLVDVRVPQGYSGNGINVDTYGLSGYTSLGQSFWTVTALPAANGQNFASRYTLNTSDTSNTYRAYTFDGTTRTFTTPSGGAVATDGLLGINYATEDIGLSLSTGGSISLDLLTNSISYITANATSNITLNIRGNATVTANSVVGFSQSTVATQLVQTGATPYGVTSVQVDGVTQTVKWAGGSSPVPVANTLLAYTFTLIKLSTTPTYTVLGSMTRFG